MTNDGDVFFNIDSRLLFQLGEKLVTNRAVALAELVKNSYDADATWVTVRLENIRQIGGMITVEDNGSGMTLPTFKKTWMRIATIDKEENPISKKYNRKKAGEKGIGRFACRRLSKKLIIKSVAETEKGNKEELNATFDWTAFTPGSDVDKIPVKYNTKPVDTKTSTGTTLILEDTNEVWNGWDIRRLRNELTELISPITFKSEIELKKTPEEYDPGFYVDFDCPEFPGKEDALDKTFGSLGLGTKFMYISACASAAPHRPSLPGTPLFGYCAPQASTASQSPSAIQVSSSAARQTGTSPSN